MVGSPRFLTSLRAGEALRKIVQILEYDFNRDMVLIFGDDFLTEVFLERFADNEYKFTEPATNSIENRIVHDGLAIGT